MQHGHGRTILVTAQGGEGTNEVSFTFRGNESTVHRHFGNLPLALPMLLQDCDLVADSSCVSSSGVFEIRLRSAHPVMAVTKSGLAQQLMSWYDKVASPQEKANE